MRQLHLTSKATYRKTADVFLLDSERPWQSPIGQAAEADHDLRDALTGWVSFDELIERAAKSAKERANERRLHQRALAQTASSPQEHLQK